MIPPTYEYPSQIYDVSANLLPCLGSFWTGVYGGRDQVLNIVAAKALVETQSSLDLNAAIGNLSRQTIPIFSRRNWFPLNLLLSEENTTPVSFAHYGDGSRYGDGTRYGTPKPGLGFSFPFPADLAEAPLIMNRFTSPSLTLTSGVNFILQDGGIIFRDDPFADARMATQTVYTDGEITDTMGTLWVFRGQFDFQALYNQYAYAIRLQAKSSRGYKDLMNAVFDALVGGTTRQTMLAGLSAITGVPLVREATETVEDIRVDPHGRLIITDQHTYRFSTGAGVLVAVGDTVQAGDSLVDALEVYELNRGVTPDNLSVLCLGPGFIATCLYGELVFENKNVPLAIDVDDPSGFTAVSWSLGGLPGDVAAFFAEMQARGVTTAMQPVELCDLDPTQVVRYPDGKIDRYAHRATMAHLLDTRAEMTGEPTPATLPKTINPLQFLVKNVLRNNAFIVRVDATHMGPQGLGLQNIRYLQRVIPPNTAMLLLVTVTTQTDSVTVANLDENVTTFTGAEPLTDTVSASSAVRERVTLRAVSGACQ